MNPKEAENSKGISYILYLEQNNIDESKEENDIHNTNQAIIHEQNRNSKHEESIHQDNIIPSNPNRATLDPQICDQIEWNQHPSLFLPDIHKRNNDFN